MLNKKNTAGLFDMDLFDDIIKSAVATAPTPTKAVATPIAVNFDPPTTGWPDPPEVADIISRRNVISRTPVLD